MHIASADVAIDPKTDMPEKQEEANKQLEQSSKAENTAGGSFFITGSGKKHYRKLVDM